MKRSFAVVLRRVQNRVLRRGVFNEAAVQKEGAAVLWQPSWERCGGHDDKV